MVCANAIALKNARRGRAARNRNLRTKAAENPEPQPENKRGNEEAATPNTEAVANFIYVEVF